MLNPWFTLAYQSVQLGWEAQRVIALRMTRLARGGASGQDEAQRMITEKPLALVEAQVAAAGDVVRGKNAQAAKKVLRVYKKKVRANKRRLSRK